MKNLPLTLLVAIALTVPLAGTGLAQTTAAAPEFSLVDLNNNTVSLSSYKGKQGALLFFWTTWCPFCRDQLKVINDEYSRLSQKGLLVLGINSGEPAARVARFLKKYSLKYPILLDEYSEVAFQYRITGVPTYVLVDKKGNIVYQDNYFPDEKTQDEALR